MTRGLEKLVADGFEWALTIDYDTIFIPQQLTALMMLAQKYGADAIFPLQLKRQSDQALASVEDGECLPGEKIDHLREVIPATAGHFGFTLLKISSVEKLPKPWFWGMPCERGPAKGRWVEGKWPDGKLDADMAFWAMTQSAHWKVLMAPGVMIGHMQNVITWPTGDGKVIHQFVDDWDKNGMPREVYEHHIKRIEPAAKESEPCVSQ